MSYFSNAEHSSRSRAMLIDYLTESTGKLNDGISHVLSEVGDYFWKITRSPEALKIVLVASLALVGGQSVAHAKTDSAFLDSARYRNGQKTLVVKDDEVGFGEDASSEEGSEHDSYVSHQLSSGEDKLAVRQALWGGYAGGGIGPNSNLARGGYEGEAEAARLAAKVGEIFDLAEYRLNIANNLGPEQAEHLLKEASLTDEEVLQVRNARILSAAEKLEANPDLWETVPQSCRSSMTRFWIYDGDSEDADAGSASVVYESKVLNQYGEPAWIYSFITADHIVRGADGKVMDNGEVLLFPGSHEDQDSRYLTLSYTQFVDENGIPQDSGLMTVFGFGEQAEIQDPEFIPLGIENVRAISSITNDILYSFAYPGITGNVPQLSESIVIGEAVYPNGNDMKILEPVGDSSTVARGGSGAAACDVGGDHLGVVSGYEGNWKSKFYLEGNPLNVQAQMKSAITRVNVKLEQMGFVTGE